MEQRVTYRIVYTTPDNRVLTFNNVSSYSVDDHGFVEFKDAKTLELIKLPKDRVIIKGGSQQ